MKFLKIVADECVEGYPDSQCPALMVYHNGECQKQFITLAEFGDKRMTPDDVEWQLSQVGAVTTELETDPAEKRPTMRISRSGGASSAGGMMTRLHIGDCEW